MTCCILHETPCRYPRKRYCQDFWKSLTEDKGAEDKSAEVKEKDRRICALG